MGKGKKKSSRSRAPRSASAAEAGTSYTPASNAGVSGILHGVPGPLLVVVSGIELIMGLVYIIIGSVHIDDCKAEPMVPIWLIMMGVALIMTASHEYFHYFRRDARAGHGRGLVSLVITGLLVLVIVAFFIVGNVFIYTAWGLPPDFGHYWSDFGCDHATFNLAFVSIIIMDVLFGVLFLAVVVFAIYQFMK